MTPRPPADAAVALRSLPRRWRGLFAGLGDDESPDDLARRGGTDGRSALDHAVHASRALALLGRAVDQTLVSDLPVLEPAVGDPDQQTWPTLDRDSVDDAIAELGVEAETLAARAERVPADQWGREATVADGPRTITALDLLWDAVDGAIADLRAAEQTLREVRGR